eukprot:4624342-Pleurochrysis_carterae.AAC.1
MQFVTHTRPPAQLHAPTLPLGHALALSHANVLTLSPLLLNAALNHAVCRVRRQSGAEVFGASPTVYVTRDPMLTADEAQTAIKLANQWADRHGGWTTSRHYSVATTD